MPIALAVVLIIILGLCFFIGLGIVFGGHSAKEERRPTDVNSEMVRATLKKGKTR